MTSSLGRIVKVKFECVWWPACFLMLMWGLFYSRAPILVAEQTDSTQTGRQADSRGVQKSYQIKCLLIRPACFLLLLRFPSFLSSSAVSAYRKDAALTWRYISLWKAKVKYKWIYFGSMFCNHPNRLHREAGGGALASEKSWPVRTMSV